VSSEIEVEAKAVEVTFYEDRARVERAARVEVGEGVSVVRLRGPGLLIDDATLAVEVDGEAKVLTARARRRHVTREQSPEVAREQLALRDAASARAEVARRALARLRSREARLDVLEEATVAELARVPRSGEVAELEEGLESLWAGRLDLVDEKEALEREVEEAERAERLAEHRARAARMVHTEYVADVEVQVEAAQAGEVGLTLTYFTACALWRPAHTARLDRASDPARLEVVTQATAWQRTGEDWSGVRCVFSTARPTQLAKPPRLEDDVVSTRPKTEEEKRVVSVEARDVEISVAGVKGARARDEMPGVDDGGEPVAYEASSPLTIASDGEPVRVQIDAATLDCEVETVCFPEVSTVAHVRARATWTSERPLLAGPVDLIRGDTLAGRALAKFAGTGEPFEMGFGPDSDLRVRRKQTEDVEKKGLRRRTHREREVELYVSNLGDSPGELTIVERLPVSEIDDVAVETGELAGGELDDDGMLHLKVTVGTRQTTTRRITYTVVHGSNVRLSM
jgi:uncharacterized protein (TIGR02231 family)